MNRGSDKTKTRQIDLLVCGKMSLNQKPTFYTARRVRIFSIMKNSKVISFLLTRSWFNWTETFERGNLGGFCILTSTSTFISIFTKSFIIIFQTLRKEEAQKESLKRKSRKRSIRIHR